MTGLTNGTAYTFRLFARRGSGASAVQSVWSNQVTATPVGVVVSKSALTVAEGASGTYTVKLSTAPSSDVTVTVGGASGDVTVSPPSLTFTGTNYSTAQTVTVNAALDPDAAADPDVTLTHSASGGGYDAVAIASVTVSVTEDDAAPGAGQANRVNAAVLPQVADGAAGMAGAERAESRLEAEMGHGFGLPGPGPLAVLTPWAGLSLAQSGACTLRLGTRYRMGWALALGLEATHRPGTAAEQTLNLRAALRW